MSEERKVAIYLRFSSEGQRNISSGHDDANTIEFQREAIQAFCKNNGYVIVAEYVDEACSGTNIKRPGFQKMMSDARNNPEWKYIFVYDFSRFSRDTADAAQARKELSEYGIRVKSVTAFIEDDNHSESLVANIQFAMNEQYSKDLSRKTHAGMAQKAKSGLYCGGTVPLGYDVEPITHKFILNKKESRAVKAIFKMYVQGFSYKDICASLNAKGYTTKTGKKFNAKTSLSSILKNEKYIGKNRWNVRKSKKSDGTRNNNAHKSEEEWIVAEIPRIISDDLFEKAQERMKVRGHNGSGSTKHFYMLSSLKLLKCAECGSLMMGVCDSSKGKTYLRYHCPNHNKNGNCPTKDIRADFLDEAIAKAVIEYVLPKHALESFNKYTNKHRNMKSYQKAIAQCESNIDNLIRNLNSMYSEPLTKALNEKYEELKTLKAKQAMLDEQIELSDAEYKKVKQYLLKRLTTKRDLVEKEFLQRVIESVTVDNNNIELTLAQC